MPPNQNPDPGIPESPNQPPAQPPQGPAQVPGQLPGQVPDGQPPHVPQTKQPLHTFEIPGEPRQPTAPYQEGDQPPLQYPAQQPASPETSPYDFFMAQSKPQRGFPSFKSPFKMAILAGVVIIIGVILLVAAVNIAGSGKQKTGVTLVSVSQEQQELIRVAGIGAKTSTDTTVKNFSVTTEETLTSAQRDLLAYMASHGAKVDPKTLALSQNPKTDQALNGAIAANTFDPTYSSIMKDELNNYVNKLNDAISLSTVKSEQDVLQQQNAGAQLLVTMLTGQQPQFVH